MEILTKVTKEHKKLNVLNDLHSPYMSCEHSSQLMHMVLSMDSQNQIVNYPYGVTYCGYYLSFTGGLMSFCLFGINMPFPNSNCVMNIALSFSHNQVD